jgi:hypothetical protein
MVRIESTPEMAAKVYETIERKLTIVRHRQGRPWPKLPGPINPRGSSGS